MGSGEELKKNTKKNKNDKPSHHSLLNMEVLMSHADLDNGEFFASLPSFSKPWAFPRLHRLKQSNRMDWFKIVTELKIKSLAARVRKQKQNKQH